MSCELWKLEISALLDGALDANQEAEVNRHISCCAECRSFFQEHSRLTHFFRESAPVLDPPEIIWQGIEDRIASRSPESESPAPLESILSWLRVP